MQTLIAQENVMLISKSRDQECICAALGCYCSLQMAPYGVEAIEEIYTNPLSIGLILLEIDSLDTTGMDILQLLKMTDKTKGIPVIVLADPGYPELINECMENGAVDCLIRPFNERLILQRVKNHLLLHTLQDENEHFIDTEATKSVSIYEKLLEGLTSMGESRCIEATFHTTRIRYYVDALLMQMQEMGSHPKYLQGKNRELIVKAAPLHDIGKILMPDGLLLRPGRLMPDEYQIVKAHTTMGAEYIASLKETESTPLLQFCLEICRHHHEKWDGTGYPDGLCKDEIPFSARVVALADIYDALVGQRSYRNGLSHTEAVNHIKDKSGTFFEPEIVDVFSRIQNRFKFIAEKWKDKLRPDLSSIEAVYTKRQI